MPAELFAAISPSEHVKLAAEVQLPCEAVMVPRVNPLGQFSARLTPATADGPALLTMIVYVRLIRSPAVTLVTPSVFEIDRSAVVTTVVLLFAVLLLEFGSGALLVVLTVFV